MDNFSDAGNEYYTGYLAAAKRLGISKGVGNNRFAPKNEISHQEMVTLLFNILQVINELPDKQSVQSVESFSDSKDIAAWAKDAMELFVENGIFSGDGDKLNPKEIANRAQMAQVLYKLFTR